ncbi:hypothetical protein [Bradyrhizobium sp. BR 1433]|uniref:hypothetical protein n=1 Tax=Bradyrhizobium sp. BR 1433 TaxID=3447967 RepID=UPI003EE61DE2
MIDVDHQKRDRRLCAHATAPFDVKGIVEAATVGEARQCVRAREVREPIFRGGPPFESGHQVEHQDDREAAERCHHTADQPDLLPPVGIDAVERKTLGDEQAIVSDRLENIEPADMIDDRFRDVGAGLPCRKLLEDQRSP